MSDALGGGTLSLTFEVDTRGIDSPGMGELSGVFEIDTQSVVNSGSDSLSSKFSIDTRPLSYPSAASDSHAFIIDTRGVNGSGLSLPFVVNTMGIGETYSTLSSAFVIDTLAYPSQDSFAAFSSLFLIDTREEFEKLQNKFDQWSLTNAPAGLRGLYDTNPAMGVTNLFAFASGWQLNDPSTWYQPRIKEIVTAPGSARGVWLRAHRRNDLPELMWTWRESPDLGNFFASPAVLDFRESSLGPAGSTMEEWDIKVPLPDPMDRNFYRLELHYENTSQ